MFGITFLHPGRLWCLAIPVVILAIYIVLSLRPGVRRGHQTLLDKVIPHDSAVKRHLSVAAALLSLVALTLAYAQPLGPVQVPRDRATVVVAIDVSLSMKATDVAPDRLAAAQQGAKEFINSLPVKFNVALVSFCGAAQIMVPPTVDRAMVDRAIDSLELCPATAIGNGVYESLEALKYAPPDPDHRDEPAPGAVVLLSDGATNTGRPSVDAARAAKDASVPVYTIAYGTPGGYVYDNRGSRQQVPVNHAELAKIAQVSGGKKYAAESLSNLKAVYATISQSLGYTMGTVEITQRFVLAALILALLAAMGVISLAARWP